jgi:hypothetical protein
MADYYPLLSRAIAGLESNTSEQRRGVYDRARAALVRQLRGADPPLSEPEITRERLALEDAVRRIEAEARRSAPAVAPAPRALPPAPSQPQRPAPHAPDMAAPVAPPHYEADPSYAPEGYEDEPEQAAPPPPPPPRRPARPRPVRRTPPRARFASAVAIAAIAVVVAGGAGLYVMRDGISSLFGSSSGPTSGSQDQVAKNEGRVGEGGQPPAGEETGSAPVQTQPLNLSSPIVEPQPLGQNPAVSQRAVLYEETPDNQSGAAFTANAVWRVESVPGANGQPEEKQLRGDISIPQRQMQVVVLIKRNTDSTLPASHTLEVQFVLPENFSNGGVANVPGLLFKESEDTNGVALEGHAVRVTNDFFLIGLANEQAKKQQNIQLLGERDWMDMPILYENGRRAVLTIEKGVPGNAAFREALAAWESADRQAAAGQ